MSTPGADTNTSGAPKFEKDAGASTLSVAATPTAPGQPAGAVLRGPDDPVGDVGVVARAGVVEHLHRDDRRCERDSGDARAVVGRRGGGPGHVGAVTLVV